MDPARTGGSPITRYTVHGSPRGSCSTTGATHCKVAGLTAGTSYTFTVTATNAFGTSPPSPPSGKVTPRARTALALTSAPRSATYGTAITATGKLTRADTGAKLAGAEVTLQYRRNNSAGAFTPVASGKTTSAGTVSFTAFKPQFPCRSG